VVQGQEQDGDADADERRVADERVEEDCVQEAGAVRQLGELLSWASRGSRERLERTCAEEDLDGRIGERERPD